jgi:hypothetical protein
MRSARIPLLFAMFALLLAAGCAPEPPSSPSFTPPVRVPPPATVTGESDWVDAFITDAKEGGTADMSVLSSDQLEQFDEELPTLACCIQSVARQLNAVNPAWGMTPGIIEQFLTDWCDIGVSHSVGRLFATIPGADLSALPALNQVISLIRRTCDYEPAQLDWTSARFLKFTTAHQTAVAPRPPAAPTQRSGAMRATFSAICGGLNKGLSGWLAHRVRSAKGNLFVTIALEAAFTFCPDVVDSIVPR